MARRDAKARAGDRLDPQWFRALGDPSRLAVLRRLLCAAGPQTVSQVADCCGVHLSGVSRHLAILRRAGIVRAERRGREVVYQVDPRAVARDLRDLADAIEELAGCTAGARL